MKTTISISPIVIDTAEGARISTTVTYISDDLGEIQEIEKRLRAEIDGIKVYESEE